MRPRVGLPALLVGALLLSACGSGPTWNVLLVTFDTTRADHLGCYGAPGDPTPNVDRLAQEGTLFERAYSAAPITAPSHATILSGRYPLGHGIRDNGLFVLTPRQVTLAEILHDLGYATAAAVGSFPLASRFGLDQGFDLYDDRFDIGHESFAADDRARSRGLYFDERRAGLVNEPLLDWLEDNHERPFFAWAHYFDPHQPLLPPPPYDQLYATDRYVGEIAYADEAFGQLLEALRTQGVDDRTIVVLTADHGEGRGQHGESTHSTLAYDTTLHVPLVVRVPGRKGGVRVAHRVGTVDIVPTLLDALGVEAPDDLHGESLMPAIDAAGGLPARDRDLYAETLAPRLSHGLGELRALYAGPYKYIHGPRPELYRVADDPDETDDRIEEEPEVAVAMRERLQGWIDRLAEPVGDAAVEPDQETRRRLEALGYLQPGGGTGPAEVVESLRDDGAPPQDRVGDINELSLAKELLARKMWTEAEAPIAALLRRQPDNATYLRLRLQNQLSSGRIDDGLATMTRLEELAPGEVPAEALLLVVEHLVYAQRIEEATRLLERRESREPTARGQWYLASLYAKAGRNEEVAPALDLALEIDREFAPARVDRAVAMIHAGDPEGAEAELRRAVADGPYYAKAHFNLGSLLAQNGDSEGALEAYRRAVVVDPSYAMAHYALVLTAVGLGDMDTATRHLGSLERLAPGSDVLDRARRALEEAG